MRSSWMIAAGLSVALGAWLATPYVLPAKEIEPSEQDAVLAKEASNQELMLVQTRLSVAEPVRRELVLNGRSEAARRVMLRAEIDGRIIGLPVDKGDVIAAGQEIAFLDQRDMKAWETRAFAMLKEREIEYEASRRLGQKGFQADTKVAQSFALLEEARATLLQSQIKLDHTSVEASFAGIVDDRMVEIGDFVQMGDPLAEVVELDPLIVAADVPESHYARFSKETEAEVSLSGFGRHTGRVHFLSSEADPETRTFRLEIELDNPDRKLPAGVTTEVFLAFDEEIAHRIEPSLLTLDDAGRIGVKIIDQLGQVSFETAQIVRSDVSSVWLAGLPDKIEIISIGQGFVKTGEKVRTVREGDEVQAEEALVAKH